MAHSVYGAASEDTSLTGSRGRIRIPAGVTGLKRFLAFAGPAYLVSVGYMDPGNWGTDIPGGARYGYSLLWVVVVSSLMAMFLQTLCTRLGIASGKDLAQCCRESYSKRTATALWVFAEVGIVACDLAEVIGSAIALNLLFHIPMLVGVLLTALDVLVLIGLMRFGFRKLEATVIALVATISVCFVIELVMARPNWGGAALGAITPVLVGRDQVFLAVAILGATVMPHNLYLHSAIVRTRATGVDEDGKAVAIRNNTADTVVALTVAMFVNAAILILAAATFNRHGRVLEDGRELENAYSMLTPMLGGAASLVFAIGLLAAGQSSTITGTLAGQVVMEGFRQWRVDPWIRRLVSRGLAIVPAVVIVGLRGSGSLDSLLIVSQVVLSMQLPFAIFPLIAFTSNKDRMGRFVLNRAWSSIGYAVGAIIVVLNLVIVLQTFHVIS